MWHGHKVKVIRRSLGEINATSTTKDNNALVIDGMEIALCYYRAGCVPWALSLVGAPGSGCWGVPGLGLLRGAVSTAARGAGVGGEALARRIYLARLGGGG